MALPADQLRLPKYLRYRLALAVLPSLVWARGRFVARIVHRDPTSWSAAVADLVRWHATARDETAEWPGRGAQESQIDAAGGDDGEAGDASGAGEAAGEGAADSGAPVATETSTKKSRPSGTLG
jgi:hypothetical protein